MTYCLWQSCSNKKYALSPEAHTASTLNVHLVLQLIERLKSFRAIRQHCFWVCCFIHVCLCFFFLNHDNDNPVTIALSEQLSLSMWTYTKLLQAQPKAVCEYCSYFKEHAKVLHGKYKSIRNDQLCFWPFSNEFPSYSRRPEAFKCGSQ